MIYHRLVNKDQPILDYINPVNLNCTYVTYTSYNLALPTFYVS